MFAAEALVQALLRFHDDNTAEIRPVTLAQPLPGARQFVDRLVARRRKEQRLGKGAGRETGIPQQAGDLAWSDGQ